MQSPYQEPPERTAARKALVKWAAVNRQRDDLVRAAREALVPYDEIQQITGLARTTIARIAPGHRYRRSASQG
jgi:S-methylmethionine-dependent homocysteine/selenocysteine methylase